MDHVRPLFRSAQDLFGDVEVVYPSVFNINVWTYTYDDAALLGAGLLMILRSPTQCLVKQLLIVSLPVHHLASSLTKISPLHCR